MFVSLGRTDEIGASCHYLRLAGTGIILDAGVDPEAAGKESLPDLDVLQRKSDRWVDHAIVTHAHHDHLGGLPVVIRTFPHVLVHMTRATRDLADLLLPASARLQRRRRIEGSSNADPLFTEEELEAYAYLYLTHDLDTPFDVTGIRGGQRVSAQLLDSGHVLGSAGVLLTQETDAGPRRIFYTSDTNLHAQAILPGGAYPDEPIDVLILESTLGADPEAELTTRRTEEKRLGESLKEVIMGGGSALLPVFALGRGQEMLALIDRYKRRGIIPDDTPVYTSGLMRAIADLYDKNRFTTPRLDEDFQVYGVAQRRLPRSQAGLLNTLHEPGIHIVGSGMMFERTISNRVAQELVEHEKQAIFLVGYAREDSPADRLLKSEPGDEVVLDESRGPQVRRCRLERFRFSGHSHRRDLLSLVGKMNPRQVILVHGETSARSWMADNIRFFYPDVDVQTPASGQIVAL